MKNIHRSLKVFRYIILTGMVFAILIPNASLGGKRRRSSRKAKFDLSTKFKLPQHPNIGGLLPATISYGSTFDPLKGVLAYDQQDGYITDIQVHGSVNPRKPGTTVLTYSVNTKRGDSKTIRRKVTVLPPHAIAGLAVTGRQGPGKIIRLGKSRIGKLSDDLTYIRIAAHALPGADYHFKLISRAWDNSGYTKTPPTAAEWKNAAKKAFYRDLYLCMKPRRDRWLKVIITKGNRSAAWIFGLKGDPGARFHSNYKNQDIWQLSRPVDEPETAREQFAIYSQGCSYWCPLPIQLEKQMGVTAHVTTVGSIEQINKAADREELHGLYSTLRSFMKGVNKRTQSAENWQKIAAQWNYAFGEGMNASFHRAYQIPIAEMNGGNAADFQREFAKYYRYARAQFNPERIIVGTALRGHTSVFAKFHDAKNPYFKAEWHKGHFSTMFQRFKADDKNLPFIIMYPRINEVWDKPHAFSLLEVHRKLHYFAKLHSTETAILDKIGILGRFKDGQWSSFALPYYAMWYNYSGYDYLNNGPFFANDWDGDGLSNEQEHALNTNPFLPDTDGDLIFDGLEVKYKMNPLNPNDAKEDFDHDRMSNIAEITAATHTTGAMAGTPPHPALTMKMADGSTRTISPLNPADAQWDPDHDLLPAWFEVSTGLCPDNISTLKNGNKFFIEQPDIARPIAGMPAEMAYHYNLDKDVKDFDGDGTANLDELVNGDDPASPDKTGDPKRKEWARLGQSLFKQYFKPEEYKNLPHYKQRQTIAIFSYSPTEHAITAEVNINDILCDATSPKNSPEKIEVMMARMMMILHNLRHHPKLWADQDKIIVSVSVRTYLKRKGMSPLRQDRGLYTISIPRKAFAANNFDSQMTDSLQALAKSSGGLTKRKGAKGNFSHRLMEDKNGIKILFFNYLEAGYYSSLKKKWKSGKAFLGDKFDMNIFRQEYQDFAGTRS